MFSRLCKAILKLYGFSFKGRISNDINKKVIIVAPHTSNWDFIFGLLYKFAFRIKCNYLGKASLFKPPMGWFFRLLGGIPVVRKRRTDLVTQLVTECNSREHFSVVIAPEGTRSKVERFKTGFYHIAHTAKIPVVMVKMDYGKKLIEVPEPFYTTGDIERDLTFIEGFFRGTEGKVVENSF